MLHFEEATQATELLSQDLLQAALIDFANCGDSNNADAVVQALQGSTSILSTPLAMDIPLRTAAPPTKTTAAPPRSTKTTAATPRSTKATAATGAASNNKPVTPAPVAAVAASTAAATTATKGPLMVPQVKDAKKKRIEKNRKAAREARAAANLAAASSPYGSLTQPVSTAAPLQRPPLPISARLEQAASQWVSASPLTTAYVQQYLQAKKASKAKTNNNMNGHVQDAPAAAATAAAAAATTLAAPTAAAVASTTTATPAWPTVTTSSPTSAAAESCAVGCSTTAPWLNPQDLDQIINDSVPKLLAMGEDMYRQPHLPQVLGQILLDDRLPQLVAALDRLLPYEMTQWT